MISVGDPHGIVPTGMAERGTEGSEPQKRAVDIGLGPLNGGGGGNVAVGVGLAQSLLTEDLPEVTSSAEHSKVNHKPCMIVDLDVSDMWSKDTAPEYIMPADSILGSQSLAIWNTDSSTMPLEDPGFNFSELAVNLHAGAEDPVTPESEAAGSADKEDNRSRGTPTTWRSPPGCGTSPPAPKSSSAPQPERHRSQSSPCQWQSALQQFAEDASPYDAKILPGLMPPTMTPHLVNPSSAAVPSTAKAPRPTLQALPASPPPPDTSQGPAVLPALSPAVPVPAGEMTASELARVLDGTSQWADPDGPLFSIGAPPLPHVTPLAGPSDAFSGPSVAPAAGHVGQGGHSDPMSVAALTQPAAATLEVPEGALAGVFGREHGGTEASGVPLAAPEYSASLPVSLPLTVGPLSGLPEPASPLPDLTTALQPPTTAPQPVLSVEALMAAVGAPAPAPAPVPFRSAPAGPQGGVSDARCDIPAEKPPGGSEDAAGGVKSELHTRCKVVMADVPTDHGRTHFRGVTRHRRTGRFEGHIWHQGKQLYLGGYTVEGHAARAHDIIAIKCRGIDNTYLNFAKEHYEQLVPLLDSVAEEDVTGVLRVLSKEMDRGF